MNVVSKHFLTSVTATEHELPHLVELVNAAYRGDSGRQGWTTESDYLDGQRIDLEMLKSILHEPRSRLLLALDASGEICGSVHVKAIDDFTSYLGLLTVDVSKQTLGIGSFLVTAAESLAQNEFNSLKMEMTVIAQRDELISWYERRGYEKTTETRPFPYGDERFGKPLRTDLYFVVLEKRI